MTHLSTFCGSLYFAAPELLNAKVYTGPEVDVWSFGVVLYVLVCGKVPFDDQSMPQLHAKIKKGLVEYPVWLSAECKHLLTRMLVTNPAARATLAEVLCHPWMCRNFPGPPDSHLVHREPLRADELDRQVVKNMKGFEFGTEEEIERRLVEILESDAYFRAVDHWERKRIQGTNGRNGHSGPWGSSLSNSSIALSYDNNGYSGGTASPKKSKRFSGFDYYRRKLFSPSSSPPASPLNSPPASQSHLSHTSLTDPHSREPPDPTYGFHPLISIYFLAREKMERERVYGPGHFASSQLSLESGYRPDATVATPAPVPTNAKQLSQPAVRKQETTLTAKPDYSMPLPRLPAPETSHFSGLSYDPAAAAPSPTSSGFPQPRARDAALTNPKADIPPAGGIPGAASSTAAKTTMPRAPQASAHRRSHSLSQRPSVSRGWSNMFGGPHPNGVDEHGAVQAPDLREPPKTAGPELTSFAEQSEDHTHTDEARSPTLSAGATLVRKFGSLLGGTRDGSVRHGTIKRNTILPGFSPRPSADAEERTVEKSEKVPSLNEKQPLDGPESQTPAPPSSIAQSHSQPIGGNHRRAATLLDTQGRTARHERRSSTGASLFTPGSIGRHRRPSTGHGGSVRPMGDKLFGRTDEEEENAEQEDEPSTPVANGAHSSHQNADNSADEKEYRPVYLKGLFRRVVQPRTQVSGN